MRQRLFLYTIGTLLLLGVLGGPVEALTAGSNGTGTLLSREAFVALDRQAGGQPGVVPFRIKRLLGGQRPSDLRELVTFYGKVEARLQKVRSPFERERWLAYTNRLLGSLRAELCQRPAYVFESVGNGTNQLAPTALTALLGRLLQDEYLLARYSAHVASLATLTDHAAVVAHDFEAKPRAKAEEANEARDVSDQAQALLDASRIKRQQYYNTLYDQFEDAWDAHGLVFSEEALTRCFPAFVAHLP